MPRRISISLESTRPLPPGTELTLLQTAYARAPSPALRERLARLLTIDDQFDAVVALYEGQTDLTSAEELIFCEAWLVRKSASADEAAWAAANRAFAAADDPQTRAAALALRGKAETRLGDLDTARATLRAALTLDPHNKHAFKRLCAIDLAADDVAAVMSLADDLTARGAAHSRLSATLAAAYARRGELDAAQAITGGTSLLSTQVLPPPPGWDSIAEFNAALASELLAHPELRFDPYGAASERTWRVDWMPSAKAPLARLLLESIAAAIGSHVDRLAGTEHPWATAWPQQALLHSWTVIAEREGFEHWHVHQAAWLSGAYYVQVPDSIAQGETNAGCIALGMPEELAGVEGAARYGTEIVRPQSGLLLMFPSHTYHRTFPHGERGRRICVAFDLKRSTRADR